MSITEDHKELEIYEIGYSILTSVSEDKLDDVVTKIKKAVTDVGGVLLDSESPFQQELAYPMSKTVGARKYVAEEAYIGWMKFECAPENTPNVKISLDKIEEVLRFLLIKATRETLFTYEGARLAIAEKEAEERGDNNDEVAEGVPKVSEETEPGNIVAPTIEQ
ncbi:MAG: 30S ribosomal protein S6 [bacterium]|nr:30S ribosomal protein S6 [bacterium]